MRGFRSPSDKRPLVLLLGWLGSKHQHLNKYTRMWQVREELGWLPPSTGRAAVLCVVSSVALKLPAVGPVLLLMAASCRGCRAASGACVVGRYQVLCQPSTPA